MLGEKVKRIVVLPDIHTPNTNTVAVKAILDFIKFYKPNRLVQLGDFCDFDSLSSFEVNSEHDIQPIDEEVSAANDLLDTLDSVLPKDCKKIMIGGNHEARYEKFRVNKGMLVGVRRLRTLLSWQKEYNLEKRGWDSVDYGDHITIGKIVFTHGWESLKPKNMAELFPGRNVIFGHLHSHQIYGCMDEKGLPIESETIGTLSKFNLSYLRGKPAKNWVNGFMHIDMRDDGTFSKHFTNIIDGKFIELGKSFG